MAKKALKRRRGILAEGRMDITFLSFVLMLLTTGLVMLFSASYAYSFEYYGDSYRFIVKQAFFAVAGLAAMFIFSKIDYHVWKRFAWLIYAVVFVLLVILLILPPMVKGMEVKRWLVIGGFSFQPSEIAKFAIVLLFAALISSNYSKMKKFKFVVFLLAILALTCVLVVLEKHLSATVLIFAIGAVMLFVGGLQKRYIIGGGLIGVGALVAAVVTGLVSYASARIKYWRDPWLDPKGKGFQTIQSLLAIGSGGIMGRGIGQSRQKYLWVPEPHNDFIFAIVCEELGLIGAMFIVALFALLVWRGFTIAMRAPDKFGALLSIGLTFQVGLQAMLNIWVVTNTIPNTGISLPFFSYGGTSLMILLAEMGIILSVSRSANMD